MTQQKTVRRRKAGIPVDTPAYGIEQTVRNRTGNKHLERSRRQLGKDGRKVRLSKEILILVCQAFKQMAQFLYPGQCFLTTQKVTYFVTFCQATPDTGNNQGMAYSISNGIYGVLYIIS
jgi:hypothetical protein